MNKTPRILVVDDESRNVKLLEAHLLPQRYEVVTAADGEEALHRIASGGIDLVLLDVMMPGLDGFEVTRRIRADERTRLLPIVLVTALTDREDRIRGIEAGCDDFISKPFDANEVLARVRTLLRIGYYRARLDEKEKFEYILHHMDNGLVLFDAQLDMVRANQRALDLLMIPPDHPPEGFLAELPQRFTVRGTGDLCRDLKTASLTFELERPETATTRPLVVSVKSSVVKNSLGEVSSIVWFLDDVTEIRKQEFAEHSFLELMSHKLRTPLTVIAGNATLLHDEAAGPLNAEQKKFTGALLNKSRELIESLEKFISFATITTQSCHLSRETIELQSYLSALATSLTKRLKDKPVHCQVTLSDAPAHVAMNREHLDIIMGNLFENAVKFNPNGDVRIRITVTPSAGDVAIAVSDNGEGIPAEEKDKIFAQFYQADKHRTGNVKGAGLGLTIVKHLVELYGGSVRVDSVVGQGSTFTLTLPMGRPPHA